MLSRHLSGQLAQPASVWTPLGHKRLSNKGSSVCPCLGLPEFPASNFEALLSGDLFCWAYRDDLFIFYTEIGSKNRISCENSNILKMR